MALERIKKVKISNMIFVYCGNMAFKLNRKWKILNENLFLIVQQVLIKEK